MLVKDVYAVLDKYKPRSAWKRGVKDYAYEIIEYVSPDTDILPHNALSLETLLLNGAGSWLEYSENGSSLVDDEDIARRLCTPSEFRRTDSGRLGPSGHETWIQCQARALAQAYRLVRRVVQIGHV